MKWVSVTLATASLLVAAGHGDRAALSFSMGGGVLTPWLFGSDVMTGTGFGAVLGVETPMAQGRQFVLKAGYFTAGTDREGFNSVNFIPITLTYRMYPFYRPYAGPRGIEPLLGAYAGGVIGWDSVEGDGDNTTTGGGVIGGELGARIPFGSSSFFEIAAGLELMPLGSSLAGEEKECSCLKIMASLIF